MLELATENLYRAFEDVPNPNRIYGCPCCVTELELQTLVEKPLRKLTPDDLSVYASSAFLTVGSVDDYLYLLPRILDISAFDKDWWPSIEVTGRAIKDANPSSWASNKREAVQAFLTAVLASIIEKKEFNRIDEWMCGAARMEMDVIPLLGQIEEEKDAVVAFWEDNSGKSHERKLGNEFWELPNKGHDQIVDWFLLPKINLIYAEMYGYKM